jgi:N-acyl-D-amino-acid deacylase
MRRALLVAAACLASPAAAQPGAASFDTVIAGGVIHDGTGGEPYAGWVAIAGDRIAAMGRGAPPPARATVNAAGRAVSPGFINMLSWATESLIADGRGLSDLKQGVTLQVMGEGWSMGPVNARMKAAGLRLQRDIKYDISWTTLGGYLDWLVRRGVSPNVASFVGATTVRMHVLGEDDVDPTPAQLDQMRALVRQAMDEGAMGVGSSLIYAPASYAETPELVALATESARCGGSYISHMRSEGNAIEAALDELIEIARQSKGPAEIYHLKLSGQENWGKLPAVLAKIEAARGEGLDIRANMYLYPAGATGLDAAMPTWVQAGGDEAWIARLKDPATRARVIAEMRGRPVGWENLFANAGRDPSRLLFIGFRTEALRPLIGQTLAQVMAARGTSAEDTIIDLVVEDGSRVDTVYFLMSEANVRAKAALPWVSLGSDAEAAAIEGVFLKSSYHPRAFGNVARFLGRYVREEKVATLPDAVRRITSLPAGRLGLTDRGRLAPGMMADVVVFDPASIADRATFERPMQYAVGVDHVWVNGVQVLAGGEPTGAKPGRVVRGPGAGRCKG